MRIHDQKLLSITHALCLSVLTAFKGTNVYIINYKL